jgi:phage portal protein BeeE
MAIDLAASMAPHHIMKLRSLLPLASATGRKGVSEKKAAGAFMSLAAEDRASWTGRSYAALSREGFVKNPVAITASG